MFGIKKEPLEGGKESRDIIDSVQLPKEGGFVIVGVNRDWNGKQGMDVGATLRKTNAARVLFSVAKALNLSMAECVIALEMYSPSQVFKESPFKEKELEKEA